MKVLNGPVIVLESAEAGRLLVATRRGVEPFRGQHGGLPRGVDQVLDLLASPVPVLDGSACALVAALVRAAESAGALGGLDVGADLRQLVAVAVEHQQNEDRRRLTREAADRVGTEHMFRNNFAQNVQPVDDLISTAEAAKRFDVSAGYLRRLARQRRLGGEARPAGKGGWMLRTEDVEEFFARGRGPGRPRRADAGDAQKIEDRPAA